MATEASVSLFRRHRNLQAPGPQPDALTDWEAVDAHLAQLIGEARTFRGDGGTDCPVTLHAGERAYYIARDAQLIEPRSAGGHWEGRYQGVSFHVPGTRSMRYRIGGSKGRYVRAPDQPTAIDTGTAVVTDGRVVFIGPRQTREWDWTKVIAVEHEPDKAWTAINVENRQKVSGIAYTVAEAPEIRFRMDLAQAVAAGTVDQLVAELEADRAAHAQQRPGPAPV
jgi:hypothetical protein